MRGWLAGLPQAAEIRHESGEPRFRSAVEEGPQMQTSGTRFMRKICTYSVVFLFLPRLMGLGHQTAI